MVPHATEIGHPKTPHPTTGIVAHMAGKICLQLLPCRAYSISDPAQIQTLGLALERQRGVHAIDSDKRVDFDTWPGTLAYTPIGVDVFSESPKGGEYLAARWIDDTEGDARHVVTRRVEVTGHRGAMAVGRRIRQALLDPTPDTFELEELALRFIGLRSPKPSAAPRISHQAYAHILEQISTEFDQPLTLTRLAASAGKSELQFLREFTQAIGMTPHAFIIETRVQAARRMIERHDVSLASIALECGFAQQSHMGSAFRQVLALTPSAYRLRTMGSRSR